jgi:predicted ATPase with chaperone activity
MLAAAMNPCPCGFFGDPTRQCHCSPPQIQRYVSKISGPLIDRIDIHIEVPAVKYKELRGNGTSEDSFAVRERVLRARERQSKRYAGERKVFSNAQMPPKLIRKYCAISEEGEKMPSNTAPSTAPTGPENAGKIPNTENTEKPENAAHLRQILRALCGLSQCSLC